MKHYRSSIPKAARERITATFVTGPHKFKAEYILNRRLVGIRYFHESGELSAEYPLRNGLLHGIVYGADEPGKLDSAEPFSKGLPHGTAKQWSADGKLIGTYTMIRGSGIDLWWNSSEDGTYLSEARYLQHGKWHGFEWWFNQDGTVWSERHFWSGQKHGIERLWNEHGRLRRGYPKYWIRNERTTKRQYRRVHANDDPTLPPFREEDHRPQRKFPPEIATHLRFNE
jgi:hypothetical protein